MLLVDESKLINLISYIVVMAIPRQVGMRGKSGSASAKAKNWVARIMMIGPQNCCHSCWTMTSMGFNKPDLKGESNRIYRLASLLAMSLDSSEI